ncbi:MAG TPA: YbdK family carboxylate-amine ligase [Solirubrobacteraceae bacterium]|nr:YbdK family carboxylate-amine ligase [Solirubrobacteraceae bacterium]
MAVSGLAPTVAGPIRRREVRGAHPLWARWNGELDQRYTLGAEEEVMLLDPSRWLFAQPTGRVVAGLSRQLSPHTSSETGAAVVELATGIHRDVDGVAAELASLRTRLRRELNAMGLTAAAAGTHPQAVWSQPQASDAARHRPAGDRMRELARREPTMALHVHVGVPDAEDAVRVLNGLRRNVPMLLALSANSPFWQGRDRGFASSRTAIFGAVPRTRLPRHFLSYSDYVGALDELAVSRSAPIPNVSWWDVRLRPALGTVEVRVMDAQSTVREVAPLVALIQSLARLELEGDAPFLTPRTEVLEENRFLASRDGMAAELVDERLGRLTPVRETLEALLAECRPHARHLGCADALEGVRRLATANGADRQRVLAASEACLQDLVAGLASRFIWPAGPAAERFASATSAEN